MTYLEFESIWYHAEKKNDYTRGYDDCMNNDGVKGDSPEYLRGYGLAYETGAKQDARQA